MKFTFAPETSPLEGYTIKRAIHRGGFGEVYYALSESGKEVALKLLNHNLEVELRGVSQCLNLKHVNLVTIFDMREDDDGDHWIVMEYIGGQGLNEVLQNHPRGMPVKQVLHWLSGICDGLSFLHDRGIVHRDLKPANVLSDQGVVKIGDVGLSKYISESRRSAQTQSVGTVYYMAPEVARGRYGREVDVYALGVMLVEMLTGHVPFDGQTTAEILMKHMTADPDLSQLPPELQPVIAATLEKDPEKRIQDVEEVERRFRAAVAGVSESDLQASRTKAKKPVPAQPPLPYVKGRKSAQPGKAAQGLPARLASRWTHVPAPVKWVIGGIAAIFVLESGVIRLAATGGLLGGAVYFGYRLFSLLFAPGETRAKASATPQAPTATTAPIGTQPTHPPKISPLVEQLAPAAYRRHAVRAKRVYASIRYTPATPRNISVRQRSRDLMNSLSVSMAAVALVTMAVFLTTNMLPEVTHAVYFGSVTMLAAWGLMTTSKLGEGRPGYLVIRRVAQAGVGLMVGFAAAGLQSYLLLSRDSLLLSPDAPREPWVIGRLMISNGSGFPTTTGFMLFFAALFAARRWWWQSDSFRKSRFRVSSALLTLLVGAVVAGLLPGFPQALGATWALAISAVVQLSAGWTPYEDRVVRVTTAGVRDLRGPDGKTTDSSLTETVNSAQGAPVGQV